MKNDTTKTYLTKEGLIALKQELETLKNTKLPAAVERVARARDFGDLSENAEYHSAREDLSWIQGRIEELEVLVNQASEIKSEKSDSVNIGCTVKVAINSSEHEFAIVGELEADPAAKKISHESPLGKALVGKKVGEAVEVDAPAGKITYTIISIK